MRDKSYQLKRPYPCRTRYRIWDEGWEGVGRGGNKTRTYERSKGSGWGEGWTTFPEAKVRDGGRRNFVDRLVQSFVTCLIPTHTCTHSSSSSISETHPRCKTNIPIKFSSTFTYPDIKFTQNTKKNRREKEIKQIEVAWIVRQFFDFVVEKLGEVAATMKKMREGEDSRDPLPPLWQQRQQRREGRKAGGRESKRVRERREEAWRS